MRHEKSISEPSVCSILAFLFPIPFLSSINLRLPRGFVQAQRCRSSGSGTRRAVPASAQPLPAYVLPMELIAPALFPLRGGKEQMRYCLSKWCIHEKDFHRVIIVRAFNNSLSVSSAHGRKQTQECKSCLVFT